MTLAPNGHPSSCPCPDCNDFDLGEVWARQEARLERWDETVPDSRTRESAGGNEVDRRLARIQYLRGQRHRTL